MSRFHLPFGVKIFAFVWILALTLPPFRELVPIYEQASGGIYGVVATPIDTLVQRYPNDPRVLAWQTDELRYTDDYAHKNEALRRYDALARRFPGEIWIVADRLRYSTSGTIEMESKDTPHPPISKFLGREGLQDALKAAVEAQKKEPDNAYFPWMEAIFRFGLRQNAEAIEALQRAGRCKHWNDYSQAEVRRKTEVAALVGNPVFEGKLAFDFAILLPHYAIMRNAVRAALWQAQIAQKRGDHQRALNIGAAVLRACEVFHRDANIAIGVLGAESMQRETVQLLVPQGTIVSQPRDALPYNERLAYDQKWANALSAYAKRHRRKDIAILAQNQITLKQHTEITNYFANNPWEQFGLKSLWSRAAFQGVWFAQQLALLSWTAGLLWLLEAAWEFWQRKKIDEDTAPTRGQIASSAHFTFWIVIGWAALALYIGVGLEFFGDIVLVPNLSPEDNQSLLALLRSGVFYVALCTWILPVCVQLWKRRRGWQYLQRSGSLSPTKSTSPSLSRRFVLARCASWLGTLIFSALAYSNGRGLWDDTIFQWPIPLYAALICFFPALFLEFRARPRLALPTWEKVETARQPQSGLFGIRLAHSSAGALAVVWSLLFLLTGLGLWPLRAELNRSLERRMEIGEMAWMKEQQKKEEQKTAIP